MPLVPSGFAELWGVAGMILCQTMANHENGWRSVASIVRERQLRLYELVACLPDVDPAHRVLSVRDNPGGGDQGDGHATRVWGKSIGHARTGSGWIGRLHGSSLGGTALGGGG